MLMDSRIQKVCSFYVSGIHFATMILPFINKQIEENTKIITFFENNYTTDIELVLSRLTITEEIKKRILKINWKNCNSVKYLNIEKKLKKILSKITDNLIIINGSEEFINEVNECIERFNLINKKENEKNNIKIMDFYEVRNI